MTTLRFDPDRIVDELPRIHTWLKGNQVDPTNVPADAIVRIDGQRLTIDVFALRDGRHYLDPKTDRPARTTVTVRLLVPVPRGLKSLKAVTTP